MNTLADPMGSLGMNPSLHLVQFISNFIQFWGKNGQNNRLAQLPSEKYWNLMCAFYYKVSASVVFISNLPCGHHDIDVEETFRLDAVPLIFLSLGPFFSWCRLKQLPRLSRFGGICVAKTRSRRLFLLPTWNTVTYYLI